MSPKKLLPFVAVALIASSLLNAGEIPLSPVSPEMADGVAGRKPLAWYMQLNEREWAELDWSLQQRVKRMTPDEIPALQQRARSGNLVAMTVLGLVYREGLQRAGNPSSLQVFRYESRNGEALKWLMRAAEAGFPLAQTEIGEMYHQGLGLDRDAGKAMLWLERAAAANYARPKLDLAQLRVMTAPTPDNAQAFARETLENVQKQTGWGPGAPPRK